MTTPAPIGKETMQACVKAMLLTKRREAADGTLLTWLLLLNFA